MWLANTGVVREVVNDGVTSVELEVYRGKKCVLVHSVNGHFRLSGKAGTRKMHVDPWPAGYDP